MTDDQLAKDINAKAREKIETRRVQKEKIRAARIALVRAERTAEVAAAKVETLRAMLITLEATPEDPCKSNPES